MAERNLEGNMVVVQATGHYVHLVVSQNDTGNITVSGSYDGHQGNGDGKVSGDAVWWTLDWHDGTKGRYEGHFAPDDHLAGTGYDINHPTVQTTWFVQDRAFPRT